MVIRLAVTELNGNTHTDTHIQIQTFVFIILVWYFKSQKVLDRYCDFFKWQIYGMTRRVVINRNQLYWSLDGCYPCLGVSLGSIERHMLFWHTYYKMSLLVFENPSIFIEVVIRAGPDKDRFMFLGAVDIGSYSRNYFKNTEIRPGVVRKVSNEFKFRKYRYARDAAFRL